MRACGWFSPRRRRYPVGRTTPASGRSTTTPPEILHAVRALADAPHSGATQMKHVFAVRWLGDDGKTARDIMLAAWRLLLLALLDRPPVRPAQLAHLTGSRPPWA